MLKSFFFLVLLGTNIFCIGQNSKYLNNYAQPSPNAASLGKYLDFPVSYNTGIPNIRIPLYELHDGSIKVDISLSYHSGGIKVSEVASWVGLGWTLNAGGAIVRTVKGAPDEGARNTGGTGAIRGYYKDSGLLRMPPDVGDQPGTLAGTNHFWDKIIDINTGTGDGEPDLYFFSCNGHSGKFVFDEYRKPRLLTEGNYKIEVNFNGSNFTSWIITDPDGTRYFFGENNSIEKTRPYSNLSGYSNNSNVPSSWCLNKIIYPNEKDTVLFTYVSENNYGYYDLGPESRSKYNYEDHCAEITDVDLIKTLVEGQRLQYIQSKNFKIEFVANTIRQDLISAINGTTIVNNGVNTVAKRLDAIKVFNYNNQCVRQFQFNYDYFVSSTSTNLNTTLLSYVGTTDSKRLKLLSVVEKSGDGSIIKPPVEFKYDETISLPRRLHYAQDHWGYFNDASNYKFMPGNLFDCTTGGANRESNGSKMKAFMLNKIIEPLGVSSLFEYEANIVGLTYSPRVVGGLRIKKIITTDNLTQNVQIKKFEYDLGILYREPTYARPLYNEYLPGEILFQNSSPFGGYNIISSPGYIKSSSSVVPLQDFQGAHIGYPKVKEVLGENGEGGMVEYYYTYNSRVSKSSRLHQENYINGFYHPNGNFQSIQPENLLYYTDYKVGMLYPDAPEQIDLLRGSLFKIRWLNASGQLIKMTENQYHEIIHENYLIRGLKLSSLLYKVGENSQLRYLLTYYKLRTGFSNIKKTIETEFKDNKTFLTVTENEHSSPFHTLPSKTVTFNSTGDTIVKQTLYSFDYNDGIAPNNFYGKLKKRNILVPLEERIWKGGKLLSASATEFKDFSPVSTDTILKPYRLYALESSTPLTASEVGISSTLTYPNTTISSNNSFFKLKAEYKFDGTNGAITEQKLAKDKTEALIWDNEISLPIAQVSNGMSTEIAFSSFETIAKGNWSYNGAPISDISAPTGSMAYNLSSGSINKATGLSSTKQYIVSYWGKSGSSVSISGGTLSNSKTGFTSGVWTYYEKEFTGSTSITISGSGYIDELKIYPKDGLMTTFSYNSQLQLQSTSTPNGLITYYEYDPLQRLSLIKDQFKNVIKAFEYNYTKLDSPNQP